MRRSTVGKKMSYAGFYKQTTNVYTSKFTHCIVTSEITEIVDAVTKTGLLILGDKK